MQWAGWSMAGALPRSQCALMEELGEFHIGEALAKSRAEERGRSWCVIREAQARLGIGPLHHSGSVGRPGSGSQWSEFREVIGTRLPG